MSNEVLGFAVGPIATAFHLHHVIVLIDFFNLELSPTMCQEGVFKYDLDELEVVAEPVVEENLPRRPGPARGLSHLGNDQSHSESSRKVDVDLVASTFTSLCRIDCSLCSHPESVPLTLPEDHSCINSA